LNHQDLNTVDDRKTIWQSSNLEPQT